VTWTVIVEDEWPLAMSQPGTLVLIVDAFRSSADTDATKKSRKNPKKRIRFAAISFHEQSMYYFTIYTFLKNNYLTLEKTCFFAQNIYRTLKKNRFFRVFAGELVNVFE